MVTIIFESHARTEDNEKEVASGHADTKLSPLGIKQAEELGERYKNNLPDLVFCSDLSRSFETGQIAFENRGVPIIKDERLRECNYGDLTQHPSDEVKEAKKAHIKIPFPNGESYEQRAEKMKRFLKELLEKYDGKTVMVIGHLATQNSLDHFINKIPLEEIVVAPWHWEPGWIYHLERI